MTRDHVIIHYCTIFQFMLTVTSIPRATFARHFAFSNSSQVKMPLKVAQKLKVYLREEGFPFFQVLNGDFFIEFYPYAGLVRYGDVSVFDYGAFSPGQIVPPGHL